jgi:hypothetical protein
MIKKIIGVVILSMMFVACGNKQEIQEEIKEVEKKEYYYRRSSDLDTIHVDWWGKGLDTIKIEKENEKI